MNGNNRLPSMQKATPRLTMSSVRLPSILSPSNHTSPAAGCSRPMIVFSVVVLPAPLAPTMLTISPSATSSETSLRALTLS